MKLDDLHPLDSCRFIIELYNSSQRSLFWLSLCNQCSPFSSRKTWESTTLLLYSKIKCIMAAIKESRGRTHCDSGYPWVVLLLLWSDWLPGWGEHAMGHGFKNCSGSSLYIYVSIYISWIKRHADPMQNHSLTSGEPQVSNDMSA